MAADGPLIVKIIFIFAIFALALIAGISPALSSKCQKSPSILSIANAFSGGVFIAIAFMHILPEEVADYYALHEDEDDYLEMTFPLPYLLVFVGYTLILLIDKVIFDTHALFDDHHGHHDAVDDKFLDQAKKSMIKVQEA